MNIKYTYFFLKIIPNKKRCNIYEIQNVCLKYNDCVFIVFIVYCVFQINNEILTFCVI